MGLLSVSRNNFEGNKRLLWIAIIILLPIVGSILYVFIGRRQRLRKAF
ncbi:PLDc N-terminal domain-containing protein [Mangrovibacterium sp.]